MSRGSSRRRMRFPTKVSVLTVVVAMGRLLLSRARCGGFHCVHDVLVARAAANVAFEAVANLLFGGRRITIDDLFRRHDHSRRAESTLQPMFVPERFLDWIQLAVC